jgi:ABC-type transport system substrate-binding protein
MALVAPAGNAATRLEPYVTRDGFYSYSVIPEAEDLYVRQSRELDRKKREAMLHQIQRLIAERVTHAPLMESAFLWAIGPRVEEAGQSLIPGHAYSSPYEDLKLKRP